MLKSCISSDFVLLELIHLPLLDFQGAKPLSWGSANAWIHIGSRVRNYVILSQCFSLFCIINWQLFYFRSHQIPASVIIVIFRGGDQRCISED